MTTGIIDFKEGKIYTDRMVTVSLSNEETHIFDDNSYEKAWHIGSGYVLVGAGLADDLVNFASSYFKRRLSSPKGRNSVAYVCTMKGDDMVHVQKFVPVKGLFFKKWKRVDSRMMSSGYLSYGSGGDYAWGALKAGATPMEAMRITSECDESTGLMIDITNLRDYTQYMSPEKSHEDQ